MKLPPAGAFHDEEEIEAVVEVLRTSKLDIGPSVAEMERRTAALLAKQHGVMVNSGSSAIRLAIDLLGLERGDEIVTSPLTFSTDVAPMVQSGIVPVFADVDPTTYQIDADAIADILDVRHAETVLHVRALEPQDVAHTTRKVTDSAPGHEVAGWAWAVLTDPREELEPIARRLLGECYVRGMNALGTMRSDRSPSRHAST